MNFIEIAHATGGEEAEVTTHTTEETSSTDEGVLASLGINAKLFSFQLINFAIVGMILWFLILKPLTSKLAERQKKIEDSLDNAERVEKNLRESEKKYQNKIDEAKVEANRMVEKAVGEAEIAGNQMKDKAREEIEGLVKQAKKNIEIEKQEMLDGLKKQTADLIVLALEKVLNEKMNDKTDRKMIDEVLGKLK